MRLSALAPTRQPVSELLKTLRQIKIDLSHVGGGNQEALARYQRWSVGAAQTLGFYLDRDVVEKLILTKRHWALLDMVGGTLNSWLISDSLDAERFDRLRLFEEEIARLERIEAAWTNVTSRVIVPDTNVYLHHEQYFDEIDWTALARNDEVRLLIPMQVVRELDKAKRGGKNIPVGETNPESQRTRARVTSRRIRERFGDPDRVVELATGVTAELLLDPVGHVPISDADTEIIDRLLVAKSLIGLQVAVLTGDGSMQFAAISAGMEAIALDE